MVGAGRRVLIVGVSAELYGSDRSLLLLASGLADRGWTVTVALPGQGPLADRLRARGIEVVFARVGTARRTFRPAGWVEYLLGELPGSVREIRRLGRSAEVVHVNTSTMIGAAVGARLARRPLVWHVRESFWGAPRLWKLFGRFIRSMARVVVCNSAATASLAGLIPDRDCTVVYNGQVFEEADAPASLPPSVVAVGRINVWKGQDVLVDALGYLQRNGVTVAAELAGDVFPGTEHLREELETRIAGQGLTGQVRLLGYVDEVPALMRRHGIFVLPSKEAEGFGLALIEAMSLGLACVATAVGAPPEILTHGETGLLVPAGDPIALGEAIRTLIDDAELRLRLGRAAFTVARERFDAATMVDRIEALYEQALI